MDIGKNKAQALAERYSALFGMDISYFDQSFDKLALDSYDNNIFFDCTDNKEARMSIENFVCSNKTIISMGNESEFGQVFVSVGNKGNQPILDNIRGIENFISRMNPKDKFFLRNSPDLLDVFKDFRDTETASCDQIILQNEQSMPINSLVAQLGYNVFYDIVSGKHLKYYMITCSIHNTFDTKNITHPKVMRDFLYKSLIGSSNQDKIEAFNKLQANTGNILDNIYKKDFSIFDDYGYECASFLSEIIKKHGYKLSTDVLLKLKEILQNKKELYNANI